jgi:hypothetical protein
MVFATPEGAKTMTTLSSSPTPTTGSITTTEAALRAILAEVAPGSRPYSTDSYLPDHLVTAAQTALDGNSLAACQHAHNALSTAAWHIARGDAPQALARMRRAQSHLLASMEGGAA